MPKELDFNADDFLKLSIVERAGLCRTLADRARALSDMAHANHRDAYAEIARQWTRLAEEMERSTAAGGHKPI